MKLLENKTILVTGGSRGIGKSIVLTLAQQGANVIFTYLSSSKKADVVIKEAQKFGVTVNAFQSDASNYQACQ